MARLNKAYVTPTAPEKEKRKERRFAIRDELKEDVSVRLRAIMAEFGLNAHRAFGELIGVKENIPNNWLNVRKESNIPKIPEAIAIRKATGVSLDWLDTGFSYSMDDGLATRLNDRILNSDIVKPRGK